VDPQGEPGAFFLPSGQGLIPAPTASSPGSADMLHGRLLAGLAARAIELEVPDTAYRLTRLTVDLFRSPPMQPVLITVRVARNGRRVRSVDVSMHCGGGEVARASGLLLRTGPHPDVTVWRPAEWTVPLPDGLAPPEGTTQMAGWDIRPITLGGFFSAERKQIWTRDTWDLVAGETMSPLVRVALAADLPNPLVNAGPEGLPFINADLTLFIRRLPRSEWIGLEVSEQLGQDGIAIGSCTIYDIDGAIGWSSICAVATQQRLPT
jgi:Thioesterase-like superfamily